MPTPSRRATAATSTSSTLSATSSNTCSLAALDVIFLNGIIGWGLNARDEAEKVFSACHRCLRKGGHFIVGWNDLSEHLPFRLEAVESLGKFAPLVFPPLGTSEYAVDNEWRHTFSFFCK